MVFKNSVCLVSGQVQKYPKATLNSFLSYEWFQNLHSLLVYIVKDGIFAIISNIWKRVKSLCII